MTSFLVTPTFYNLKHCFIELSQQLEYYSYKHVALVEWSKGKAHLWVAFRIIPLGICRLDFNFSTDLGLVQESNLYVSFPNVYYPDCIRIFITPNRIEDWEILDPETHKLTNMLLVQQRILSKGLTMPFWVHSNICVYLRVLDVYPFSDHVILQPNSELNLFYNSIQFEKFILKHESILPIRQIDEFDDFIPSELFGRFVDYVRYSIQGLSSYHFTNERIPTRDYDASLENEVRKLYFLNNLFKCQNASGCLLNFSQFRTDGYSLYLNHFPFVLPQNICQTILLNSQFPVFVEALLITTSLEYIHPGNNSFPTRLFSKSVPLDLELSKLSFLGENISESICFRIYPSSLQHSKICKVTLQISQKIYVSIGELAVIATFKEFVSALSIDSPLPVLCNQSFLLQRDNIQFWIRLKLECLNYFHSQSYCVLNASILDHIPIHITTLVEIHDVIPNKSLEHSKYHGEKYFFAYNELKSEANRIIDSFLSPFNQLRNHLALLVTSDTNTPQIGRKSLVKYILDFVRTIDSNLIINSVDGLLLKGKKFDVIKRSLLDLFNQKRNSIAIIYNFDHLVPEPNRMKLESETNDTICQYIFSEINRERSWRRKFIFLATSTFCENLHNSMVYHKGRHIFQHTLIISRPNDLDRSEILETYINLYSDVLGEINSSLLVANFPTITPCDFLPLIKKSIQDSILDGDCLIDHKLLSKGFSNYILLNLGGPEMGLTDGKIGIDKINSQIYEIIKLQIKFPRLISLLPLKIKLGILLYGMPGTGKTFLVESLINENNINVIKIRGPEILEKYVGASEERIRDIFSSARNTTPCLIFFDEFDSIARRRGSERTGVLDRVVNQLLTELDGVREIEGISIIVTTCHPELIDPALLREGRLGMHIECTLPNDKERLQIMESLVEGIGFNLSLNVESGLFVEQTIGFTRADIKAILTNLNEFKLRDCFDRFISNKDLMEAIRITVPSLSKHDINNYELNYQFFRIPDRYSKSMAFKVTCA